METLLLRAADVEHVIRQAGPDIFMDAVIARLREGLAEVGRGRRPQSPPRSGFVRERDGQGVLEWMPHYDPAHGATIKVVGYTPTNPVAYGLPTIIGTVARYDDGSGRLVAFADGVLLTAVRTGAASAVASELLARPDAEVVGIVGAGAQAVTQLHALTRVFGVRTVLVWDVDRARAKDFEARVGFLGIDVEVAPPETVLREVDILTTATSVEVGGGPVVPDGTHWPHLHVNAIGSDLPGKTELPRTLLERAFVCPDHRAQARLEGESQQLVEDRTGPELPRLCADPATAQRYRDRLTVFDSTGFAVEDHLALDVLLEYADRLGVGSRVAVEWHPSDPFNPYSGLL